MKRKISVMAMLAAVVILAAACGKTADKQIDAKGLAASLAQEVSYKDTLEELTAEQISIYFEVEEGVTATVYMGSGSTAEEVAVFEAKDEETAKRQLASVETYLEEQAESFRDYIPEEVKRIDDAVVKQQGNYVVLCVSDDSAKAEEIIEKAFQ